MSEWTQVAKTDDVPADGTFPATFNGEPVCLYNLDGGLRGRGLRAVHALRSA